MAGSGKSKKSGKSGAHKKRCTVSPIQCQRERRMEKDRREKQHARKSEREKQALAVLRAATAQHYQDKMRIESQAMLKDFERRAMSMEDLDAKRQTKIAELERQMIDCRGKGLRSWGQFIDWERMGPEGTEQDQITRPKEAQQKDEEAMQNDQEAPEALQAFKAADEAEQVKALLKDEVKPALERQEKAKMKALQDEVRKLRQQCACAVTKIAYLKLKDQRSDKEFSDLVHEHLCDISEIEGKHELELETKESEKAALRDEMDKLLAGKSDKDATHHADASEASIKALEAEVAALRDEAALLRQDKHSLKVQVAALKEVGSAARLLKEFEKKIKELENDVHDGIATASLLKAQEEKISALQGALRGTAFQLLGMYVQIINLFKGQGVNQGRDDFIERELGH